MLARRDDTGETLPPRVRFQLLLPFLGLDDLEKSLVPERGLGGSESPGRGKPAPCEVLGGYSLLAQRRHRGEPPGLALSRAQAQYAYRPVLLMLLRAPGGAHPYVDVA